MKWWLGAGCAGLLLAGYVAALPRPDAEPPPGSPGSQGSPTSPASPASSASPSASAEPSATASPPSDPKTPKAAATAKGSQLPFGGTQIFPGRTLVAYYGTAGTGSLGVLGERSVPVMTRRLREAAKPFARPGRPAQIVYELIATVADATPGRGRDYSHDIARAKVQQFIDAAHRNETLLVLDVQPGRSDFLDVAKRWRWALNDPWVSLALDPEWRMGPRQVPGRVIGSVGAGEVNRVGAWLDALVRDNDLPDKLLILHQFRREMVRNPAAVRDRPRLAEIQHVDGFGTRRQKLATYHHVEQSPQFRMGFKLFYDEDTNLMNPAGVLGIRPAVRFVSYQ